MAFHGDVLNGLRHFKKAFQNRSGDTELMQMMSWLYALIGKTEEAITLADQCIDIDPLNSVRRLAFILFPHPAEHAQVILP